MKTLTVPAGFAFRIDGVPVCSNMPFEIEINDGNVAMLTPETWIALGLDAVTGYKPLEQPVLQRSRQR